MAAERVKVKTDGPAQGTVRFYSATALSGRSSEVFRTLDSTSRQS